MGVSYSEKHLATCKVKSPRVVLVVIELFRT